MLIDLPAQVGLRCPQCGLAFAMAAADLDGVALLHCPRCAVGFDLYGGLEPQLRSKIYHALRNAIEQRVFEQQQIERGDYFEDEANLGRQP